MSSNGIQLIFGGASFMDEASSSLEEVEETLKLLEEEGVRTIDTARIYGSSEELLGRAKASSRFSIDTKYPGGFSLEPSSEENVIATGEESLRKLQTAQVDVYYIHAPDRNSSLEEVLAGINSLHEAGKFRRFGLSNFLADEVDEVMRIASERNYVLPTVYQGNYSAIARRAETELLPVLRKNNLAFYAYSPIAGGFLTKSVDQLVNGGEGRWDPSTTMGGLYHSLYNKPGMLEGLTLWEKISKDSGIPKVELAYRWVVYHSALKGNMGDGVILGSRNVGQFKGTLDGLQNGPLLPEVVGEIENIWKLVETESPLDNFNGALTPQQP